MTALFILKPFNGDNYNETRGAHPWYKGLNMFITSLPHQDTTLKGWFQNHIKALSQFPSSFSRTADEILNLYKSINQMIIFSPYHSESYDVTREAWCWILCWYDDISKLIDVSNSGLLNYNFRRVKCIFNSKAFQTGIWPADWKSEFRFKFIVLN